MTSTIPTTSAAIGSSNPRKYTTHKVGFRPDRSRPNRPHSTARTKTGQPVCPPTINEPIHVGAFFTGGFPTHAFMVSTPQLHNRLMAVQTTTAQTALPNAMTAGLRSSGFVLIVMTLLPEIYNHARAFIPFRFFST